VMFANTLGATMSRDLKPYIGQNGGNGRLWKCDTADLDDAGTAFQGLVTYPDRHYGGLDHACIETGSVSMAASGTETRALRQVEGVELGDDIYAAALSIGDASATASVQWTIDALIVPVERKQELVVA
jgi:hypothetical protein